MSQFTTSFESPQHGGVESTQHARGPASNCLACPSDCSACAGTTITLSGFDDSCYALLNGFAITISRTACAWAGSTTSPPHVLSATVSCAGDTWGMTVSGSIDVLDADSCFDFVTITGTLCNTTGCPLGAYTVTITGFSDSDTGVATIT